MGEMKKLVQTILPENVVIRLKRDNGGDKTITIKEAIQKVSSFFLESDGKEIITQEYINKIVLGDKKHIHVQSELSREEIDMLKKKSGKSTISEALLEAVCFYLKHNLGE